jgi:hypothetical protein
MAKFKLEALQLLIKKLQGLDIDVMMFEILQRPSVQEHILELNRAQLRDGVNAFGTKLSSINPYEEAYAKINGTTVDLNVTGGFYRTFEIDNQIGGFDIVSNTALYGYLKNAYGESILGLTQPSLKELQKYLTPLILEYIKDAIQ